VKARDQRKASNRSRRTENASQKVKIVLKESKTENAFVRMGFDVDIQAYYAIGNRNLRQKHFHEAKAHDLDL
jgi:hypothetical protein